MISISENCYKGTHIWLGNGKRKVINTMVDILLKEGFTEIQLPIIQHSTTFYQKIGEENITQMFFFEDNASSDLCLAPEYTAIIQGLKDSFKHKKDALLFYVQECFRGEKPQQGRYRQFTQLGVEIVNPSKDWYPFMTSLAKKLVLYSIPWKIDFNKFQLMEKVPRGLDYYVGGKGFEITCDLLGAQKQLCGGGAYEGGIGFAIGVDRLLLLDEIVNP